VSRQEFILYTPVRATVNDGAVSWEKVNNLKPINGFPQLFWSDGYPWREANLWLMLQHTTGGKDLQTIKSKSHSLHSYCKWLEETDTDWRDFPAAESDRCLVKYRGHLIKTRKASLIAPSTTTQRMRVVIQFYRWLRSQGLINPQWPMWRESFVHFRINNSFGLERTLTVSTTSLSIPNRSKVGEKLEDGLYPVSNVDRDKIVKIALEHCPYEIYLFLMAGFFTGMRIQTLAGLTIQTLENAVQDPASEDLYRIAVGPAATPSVPTKNDVTGHVWISKVLLDELKGYCYSASRLLREAKANAEHKNLVFLTKHGNPYAERNKDHSPALNVAMHSLRKAGMRNGVAALQKFKFHQTRCTFATELARLSIGAGGAIHAIAIVKDALLHRDEATTMKYIKFVEKYPIKISMANEFTKAFFNVASVTSSSI